MSQSTASDSPRRILGATVLALVAAAVALVAFVLPAEYGVDPLGTGRLTGLLALAEPRRDVLEPADSPPVRDVVRFPLQPFESVEYKYRLEEGAGLVFSWQADGEVLAELHAEPDGAPEGFAESFDRSRSTAGHGSYHAGFPGWHGWFWENRGAVPVTVEFTATGFFSAVRTYGGGRVQERALGDAAAAAAPEDAARP
ncbi:MAG: hypothetical protein GVY21_10365 [Gammaproteobacteria bacterium]|jgi:hypothetical protein|nr:hypothetical protein [Gammaproteobacteria bacterium]